MTIVTLDGTPYCLQCLTSFMVDLFSTKSKLRGMLPKTIRVEEDPTSDLLCDCCNELLEEK